MCTVEPSFFSKNHLMLGKTFLRQNKKEDAKAWLLKVVNRPCKTVDDEQVSGRICISFPVYDVDGRVSHTQHR